MNHNHQIYNTHMKPYVIGIDIGGTNTVFGIVDARGVV
ncbi:MAG: ROK family protein, partial [Duncaniella sp.]|nr:ROK family protein [Duncaniella sp.]